jgi:hypothetical protein
VRADGTALVTVNVRNDGWAAPYTPRTAKLRLTGASGSSEVAFTTNADARFWLPGTTTTLTATVGGAASGSPSAGRYELALALPATEATTSSDPRFAVRTANVGTWDAATGVNRLAQAITVGASVDPSSPAAQPGAAVSASSPRLAATGPDGAPWGAAVAAAVLLLVGAAVVGGSAAGRRPSGSTEG